MLAQRLPDVANVMHTFIETVPQNQRLDFFIAHVQAGYRVSWVLDQAVLQYMTHGLDGEVVRGSIRRNI